jgi:hypothetical protein
LGEENKPASAAGGPIEQTGGDERRRLPRRQVFRPIRVRPSFPGDRDFDEVLGTVNAHREGLFFVTELSAYRKGLRLFVTMPYSPHASPGENEFIGEVVRVESLPDGKFGVAVHLVQSFGIKDYSEPSSASRK